MQKRYSEEERREILDKLAASGISRKAFCREQGLCYATLGNWLKKAKEPDRAAFAVIDVSDDRNGSVSGDITVDLASGLRVHFPVSVSMSYLVQFCREIA